MNIETIRKKNHLCVTLQSRSQKDSKDYNSYKIQLTKFVNAYLKNQEVKQFKKI